MYKYFLSAPTPRQAVGELLFASSIWGFGFVCTRWALDFAQPFWLNALRFNLAFFCALPFVLFHPRFRPHCTRSQFCLAAVPGFFLSGAILLQTAGLPYTTVTKSGFITVLYIVFVPFLERWLLSTKIPPFHFLFVALAIVGSALICQLRFDANLNMNYGDLLTLGCALVASVQIVLLEKISTRIDSAFVFNVFQTFWAGVLPLFLAVLFEKMPQAPISATALSGILILAFASSLFAFLIQVRTQKVLSSSVVSMLFLLESPFAALFAYYIFMENMTLPQWSGAVLILAAAAGSTQLHRFQGWKRS